MNPGIKVLLPQNFAADIVKKEKAAVAEALTQAAFHLRNKMAKEIRDSIKNPIPRTEKAQLFKVNKDKLYVDFFLNDNAAKSGVSPAKYLSPLIEGGARGNKAMENYFGKRFFVPNPDTQLDAYGNVPGKTVTRLLSDVKAFSADGFTMNAAKGKRGVKKRKKTDGFYYLNSARNPKVGVIMRRVGQDTKPFGVLTPTKPQYEKGTLDWYYVVEKFWPPYIREELDKTWAKYFTK